MDKGELDLEIILETLSELILDRNEVITVTHLTKSQSISPSIARQCMSQFLLKNQDKVKPVFCLSGLIDGKLEFQLCSKPKPEKFASCEYFSSKLYSLQSFQPTELSSLCLPLLDEHAYQHSTIKYPGDNISSDPQDRGIEALPNKPSTSDKTCAPSSKVVFGSSSTSTKKPAAKSSSIQSMFSNKPTESSKKSQPVSKPLASKSSAASNKSPIKSTSSDKQTAEASPARSKEDSNEASNKRSAEEDTEERSPPVKKPKKNQQISKGRKRVILEDSDDEGPANDEGKDGEDEIHNPSKNSEEESSETREVDDDSPLKENKYVPSPRKNTDADDVNSHDNRSSGNSGRRVKRKVLKDVTHVDEDGFLITDKIWAEESCSEDESSAKDNAKDARSGQSNVALPHLIVQPNPKADGVSPVKKTAAKTVKKTTGKKQQGDLFSFFGKK